MRASAKAIPMRRVESMGLGGVLDCEFRIADCELRCLKPFEGLNLFKGLKHVGLFQLPAREADPGTEAHRESISWPS